VRPHKPDAPPPLWTSTCGRHEIHVALLKQLVQLPSGLKAEIRLCDCNLFKTVLLIIFITNLYRRKISTFYSVQRRNSGKKYANFLAWEEYRLTSVDSNFKFLCGCPHGAWPPSPHPHASTWAWPPPPCGRHKWMAPYMTYTRINVYALHIYATKHWLTSVMSVPSGAAYVRVDDLAGVPVMYDPPHLPSPSWWWGGLCWDK